MRIGASTGSLYPHWLTEDAVDALARSGFEDLELVLQTPGEYSSTFARTLTRRVADSGTSVSSIHSYTQLHPFFDPYPRRRTEAMDLFRQGLELAEMASARCLIWHGLTRVEAERGVEWDAFRDVLARLGAEAESHGVLLTLENVSWCAVHDALGVRTVRGWDLPLGFTFDPFQAVDAGVDSAHVLESMGGVLYNVHLSDYQPGGARHLPAGEGSIDWRLILGALRDMGYSGPLILEGNCKGDIDRLIRSRDVIASIVARWENGGRLLSWLA